MSLKTSEQHIATIQAFASTALLNQLPPQGLLSLTSEDAQAYLHTAREQTALTSVKRFARLLRETDRLKYEQAEDPRQALREMRDASSSDS